MFKFLAKRKAEEIFSSILSCVSDLSKQTAIPTSKLSNVDEITRIFVGATCFFITGITGKNDVAFELIPAYQRSIRQTVNETEYNRKSESLQKYYSDFRNAAVEVQDISTEFQNNVVFSMIERFTSMTLEYLDIEINNSTSSVFGDIYIKLVKQIQPNIKLY